MPEQETPPMHPELAAALRRYEIEIRDGTERSQTHALEVLKTIRRKLGEVALTQAPSEEAEEQPAAA